MTKHWPHTVLAGCSLLFCLIALPADAADLVETAEKTKQGGQFRIDHLAIALEVTGLAESLEKGSHTVFAPTNQAFRRLKLGRLKPGGPAMSPEDKIRAADRDDLAAVLRNHIVEGTVPYSTLLREAALETLGGTTLEIKPTEGGVMINGVTITKPDLQADNGVIHVVDAFFVDGE